VRLLVASANAWSATTFAGRIDPGEAKLEDIAGLSSDVIGGFKFNQFAELSAEAVYDFKLDWFDALLPKVVDGLHRDQSESLTSKVIGGSSGDYMENLKPNILVSILPVVFIVIPPEAFQAFESGHRKKLENDPLVVMVPAAFA
jgi:hypothetical protein